MNEPTTKVLKNYLSSQAENFRDNFGEVNTTLLAENAADHFDCDFWLDDPDSIVWELAVEFE